MINLNEKNINIQTKYYSEVTPKMMAHSGLKICYIISGTSTWNIEGTTYEVAPDSIILLSNRQKRTFYNLGKDGMKICIIRLERQAFLNTSHLLFFMNITKEKKAVIKDEELLDLIKSVNKEYTENKSDCFEMMSAKLTEFFVTAKRKYKLKYNNPFKIDQNMIKVLDYIDENITEKVTLTDAAKIANMTDSSFSRLFSAMNGINFKKYIMIKRVEYAISLLESTDKNIIDIAYECGFSSISGFYDTFRKITGTTPVKYR